MSEYEYYEFFAVEKPLNQQGQEELTAISSRAIVTASGFKNVYNYGSFRGNPKSVLEKYFDVFVYVSNWGVRELTIKIPARIISLERIKQFCISDSVNCYEKENNLIIKFIYNTEDYDWEDGEGWMTSLVSIRADIISGDYRALYLAWLSSVMYAELEDKSPEPPVPPNLKNLNSALVSFTDFMGLDEDLITVAAEVSVMEKDEFDQDHYFDWVMGLPEKDKVELLKDLLINNDPVVRYQLVNRYKTETGMNGTKISELPRRKTGTLLKRSETYAAEKKAREEDRVK